MAALRRIGDWYGRVREAFDGTVPCSHLVQRTAAGASGDTLFRYDELLLTRRGNTIYVHCPHDLQTGGAVLSGFAEEPRSVTLLNDGRELAWAVDVIPWRWTARPLSADLRPAGERDHRRGPGDQGWNWTTSLPREPARQLLRPAGSPALSAAGG